MMQGPERAGPLARRPSAGSQIGSLVPLFFKIKRRDGELGEQRRRGWGLEEVQRRHHSLPSCRCMLAYGHTDVCLPRVAVCPNRKPTAPSFFSIAEGHGLRVWSMRRRTRRVAL